MHSAIIVDGVRTPFFKAGTLPNLNAVTLALTPIRELQRRYPDFEKKLDLVIGSNIGNQLLPPDGSNFARVILLNAGFPHHIGAWTVNINCASGLHAILDAVKQVELGLANFILVIATEVMSDYAAVYSREQRTIFTEAFGAAKSKSAWWKKYPKLLKLWAKIQLMRHDPKWMIELGLTDPTINLRMDKVTEKIAAEWQISRYEQDLFALESQRRASAAKKAGRLAEEIVDFGLPGQGNFKDDNGIRDDQTLEKLARLRPIQTNGTVTPGNSSQVTDGAVAILVANEEFARGNDLPILAGMKSHFSAVAGCDPERMGLGPVSAIKKLLNRTGLKLSNVSLIETNEAFAAVVLAQSKALASQKYCSEFGLGTAAESLAFERTNVNGGAIAIGHPVSASGGRLVLTCAKELRRRNENLGLVTLCIGGGQGEVAVIENR